MERTPRKGYATARSGVSGRARRNWAAHVARRLWSSVLRTRPPILVELSDATATDRLKAGGKGASLARLSVAGLPVPAGLVLTTDAFWSHVAHHGLLSEARSGDPHLAEALDHLPLEPRLAGALREATARLNGPLAVRSSGVDEDGAKASHAGQFHTTLGVAGTDALEQAVRTCWASAFSARARAYQRSRIRRDRFAGIAVVVQEMVSPRAAGVAFSINPVSGDWREMTVEAARGLGAVVVDGQVLPDFYRVRRPRRLWPGLRRLGQRLRVAEIEREVNPQEQQLVLNATGGTTRIPVPADQVRAAKLSPRELARLCRLVLRVESLEGAPQDVEWAIDRRGDLHLLQARPITVAHDARRDGEVVWTRRFLGERWTEPATPLGWSLVRRELEWLIAYPDTSRRYLGGAPPTRLHRCAPYLNSTVFRHLAFKLPGAPPPRFMLELLPPEEESAWLRRRAAPPDWRVYASIFATTFREQRWRRFRWNPVRNWAHWDEFAAGLDRRLLDLPPVHQPRARAEAARALVRAYIKIHVCSLLFANIGYELAAARLTTRGHAQLVDTVLRPLAPSATLKAHQALWRLGRGEVSLDDVLADHGKRAPSSWELFSPRWCEAPELVAPLAEAAGRGPDPLLEARAAIAEADAAMEAVPLELRGLVQLVRRYLQLREDQRVAFEQITWEWKQSWVALEDRTGLALRFLDIDEADGFLAGRLTVETARALVDRRRSQHADETLRWQQGDAPPAFLGQDVLPTDYGRRLRGRGISRGIARGTARVAHRLQDAHALRPGEILVTRATDPGWTPLFRTAAGLVLEQGGMLSHGAVVAREYGLPGVVNVVDATRRIQTGQQVTVDGARGLVVLE